MSFELGLGLYLIAGYLVAFGLMLLTQRGSAMALFLIVLFWPLVLVGICASEIERRNP